MKKVLSVLLAAAMVMGMSVTSMAATVTFGKGEGAEVTIGSTAGTNNVSFGHVAVVRDDAIVNTHTKWDVDAVSLEAGDTLYFMVEYANAYANFKAPSNWVIKMKDADHVKSASFYNLPTTITAGSVAAQLRATYDATNYAANPLWVKVTLESDFDHLDLSSSEDLEAYFYIYDTKAKASSDKVAMAYDFATLGTTTLTEDDLDWVITVSKARKYYYDEGEKAAYGVFDFNNGSYVEFKLYDDETYTLSASEELNKTLSKEYDTDVEVITYRLGNVNKADIVFESAKDDKQVVAVVDGELVPVEAEYVEDYKFANATKVDGYVVENAEYTAYALIDADIEIAVEEEVEEEVKEEVKANPETGSADFVGAAVALAVVSVAAAGALALKK